MARTFENTPQYTAPRPNGQQILQAMAGWEPTRSPVHRALEAVAAEMVDLDERDHAARVAFQRRAVS